jgi:hypothetical protein
MLGIFADDQTTVFAGQLRKQSETEVLGDQRCGRSTASTSANATEQREL